MPSFTKTVDEVIRKSDIVLEILDARFINETRNHRMEKKIRILIHVINKCDYVDKKYLDRAKRELENCVYVSAKKHIGTGLLRKKIKELAAKNKIKNPLVGVVGYPNVGKSSVINALKGKASARTSSEAGFTKGKQYLKISSGIMMIDTPGVISREKKEEEELVLIDAKNPHSIQDPDLAVFRLMKNHPGKVEKRYGVKIRRDKEAVIEDIAIKLNLKKKGNLPDIERASIKILRDWLDWKIN